MILPDHNQHKEQYELEKRLAERLRQATKNERQELYGQVYDEFFQFVARHPGVSHQDEGLEAEVRARQKWRLVERYVNQNTELLEIGAGNFAFAIQAASHVKKVYALEVSSESKSERVLIPKNITTLLSPTGSIPLPNESVDIVYSNQVLEHLHPEDALEQLKDVYRVLKKSGVYVCMTPNRLSGPHDISKYFDSVATGLHLKEYTVRELTKLFRQAGFSRTHNYAGGKGVYVRLALWVFTLIEMTVEALPSALSKQLARSYPARACLGITAVAIK